jgi:hypothetical protein
MKSARDSAPDPRRAGSQMCPPPSVHPCPHPVSAVAPLAASPSTSTPPECGNPRPASPTLSLVSPTVSCHPKLLDRLAEALRARHYSPRTEQTYRHWVKRFIFFHHSLAPGREGRAGSQRVPDALSGEGQGECLDAESGAQCLAVSVSSCPGRQIGDLGEVVRESSSNRGRSGSSLSEFCCVHNKGGLQIIAGRKFPMSGRS